MGQFLGFLVEHSSQMTHVHNLPMNFMSPQFCVIFNEFFYTINNTIGLEDLAVEAILINLFKSCRGYYEEKPLVPEGASAPPTLREGPTVDSP